MTPLAIDIVQFLRGEKRPYKTDELIRLIIQEAAHNRQWATASWQEWKAAVDEAVREGEIEKVGETLWIATRVKHEETQLELF